MLGSGRKVLPGSGRKELQDITNSAKAKKTASERAKRGSPPDRGHKRGLGGQVKERIEFFERQTKGANPSPSTDPKHKKQRLDSTPQPQDLFTASQERPVRQRLFFDRTPSADRIFGLGSPQLAPTPIVNLAELQGLPIPLTTPTPPWGATGSHREWPRLRQPSPWPAFPMQWTIPRSRPSLHRKPPTPQPSAAPSPEGHPPEAEDDSASTCAASSQHSPKADAEVIAAWRASQEQALGLRHALRQAALTTHHRLSLTKHSSTEAVGGLWAALRPLGKLTAFISVLLPFIAWLACTSHYNTGHVRFCDTEFGGGAEATADCDVCPIKGYCADGQLVSCEPPFYAVNDQCTTEPVVAQAALSMMDHMQAALQEKKCSPFTTARGTPLRILKEKVLSRLARVPLDFESVWDMALDRMEMNPTLYKVRPAVVAGERGLELVDITTADRLHCSWTTHRRDIAACTLISLMVITIARSLWRHQVPEE